MKNYTSQVSPDKSIWQIEQLLIKAKARSIAKEYGADGKVAALSFTIKNPETECPVYIRLPCEVEGCYAALGAVRKDFKWYTDAQKRNIREQAERTAWRILWDWVAVQLSMIEMRQAEMLQVFLPYIWNGQATLYQQMKAAQTPCIGYNKPAEEPADDADEVHAA